MKYEENIKEEKDKKVDIKIGDMFKWTRVESSENFGICVVLPEYLVSLKLPNHRWEMGNFNSIEEFVEDTVNRGKLKKLNPGDSVTLTQE